MRGSVVLALLSLGLMAGFGLLACEDEGEVAANGAGGNGASSGSAGATNGGGGSGEGGQGGAGGGVPGGFSWTEFSPSSDTTIIYLSTDGDDANDCVSETTPCQTLMRGESLLRDGYPDWLLLKRGDVWLESFSNGWSFGWTKSGRAAAEPMLISSYGASGPRPAIHAGQEHGFHRHGTEDVHDLALVDIHFRAHTRDPYSTDYVGPQARQFQSGFRWTGDGNVARILVEGCKFEFFGSNFAMHTSGNGPLFQDVKVRGNVFYSAWTGSSTAYSQGLYADEIDGLLIEGNVFDRNGGLIGFTNDPNGIIPNGLSELDVTTTWFNHQIYEQSNNLNVTIINNIFANGDGVQMRAGGLAQNNLFTRVINSVSMGPATTPVSGGVYGSIVDNVFVEGTDFSPGGATPGLRAQGINIANIQASQGLVVERNIFSNDMSEDRYGHAVAVNGGDCGSGNAYPCPVDNVTIRDNVIYNWRGGFRFTGVLDTELQGITVSNNLLQNPSSDQATLVRLGSGFSATVFTFSSNSYERGGASDWFRIDTTSHDFSAWVAQTGAQGSQQSAVTFPDPSASVAAYNALQGGDATHEAFMARAREQSRDNWDPAYEAIQVNAYFQAALTP